MNKLPKSWWDVCLFCLIKIVPGYQGCSLVIECLPSLQKPQDSVLSSTRAEHNRTGLTRKHLCSSVMNWNVGLSEKWEKKPILKSRSFKSVTSCLGKTRCFSLTDFFPLCSLVILPIVPKLILNISQIDEQKSQFRFAPLLYLSLFLLLVSHIAFCC